MSDAFEKVMIERSQKHLFLWQEPTVMELQYYY